MKQKIFLFLFLFLIIIYSTTLGQKIKVTWINNVEYEKSYSALLDSLAILIENEEANFTIITGNLTSNGSNMQFDNCYDRLSMLKTPLFVTLGELDNFNSESAGSYFMNLWKNNKFFKVVDSSIFIGLSCGIPFNTGKHFSKEDLKWLSNKFIDSKAENIFLFVDGDNSDIDNFDELIKIFEGNYNLKIFVGHSNKFKTYTKNGIRYFYTKSFSKKKGGNTFTSIELENDTVKISGIENNKEIFREVFTKSVTNKIKVDRKISFVNHSTEILMNISLEKRLIAEPLIYKGNIVVADYSGIISYYDTLGTLIWKYNSFGNIISKPIAKDNILAVATTQGDLLTLSIDNGKLIQSIGFDEAITSPLKIIEYKGNKEILSEKTSGSNSAIILGTSAGNFYCYDFETLEELWKNSSSKKMIRCNPTIVENKIFYTSLDGFLYAVDAKQGWLIWKYKNKEHSLLGGGSLVSDNKRIFIASQNKFITVVDLRLGSELWSTNSYKAWSSLGISANGKSLFIKSEKDKFYIVNSQNGRRRKTININYGTEKSFSNAEEFDKVILVPSDNGTVYRVNKQHYYKSILFMGNAKLHSVQQYNKDYLLASNIDGKIILFKIIED